MMGLSMVKGTINYIKLAIILVSSTLCTLLHVGIAHSQIETKTHEKRPIYVDKTRNISVATTPTIIGNDLLQFYIKYNQPVILSSDLTVTRWLKPKVFLKKGGWGFYAGTFSSPKANGKKFDLFCFHGEGLETKIEHGCIRSEDGYGSLIDGEINKYFVESFEGPEIATIAAQLELVVANKHPDVFVEYRIARIWGKRLDLDVIVNNDKMEYITLKFNDSRIAFLDTYFHHIEFLLSEDGRSISVPSILDK